MVERRKKGSGMAIYNIFDYHEDERIDGEIKIDPSAFTTNEIGKSGGTIRMANSGHKIA